MKTTFNKTGVNKMKSFTSALLVMAIIATMFSFPMTASAADLGKETKTKEQLAARTIAEIRQDMMDTYGFDDVDTFDVKTNGKAAKQVYIDLENTLSLVGRVPLRKAAERANGLDGDNEFFIGVTLNCTWAEARGGERGVIFVTTASTLDKRLMVHELGHVLDFGVLRQSDGLTYGSAALKKINGSYNGYTSANQYVTNYAANNEREDFAEMFATMVLNGGSAPYAGTKDTILHKKYVKVYNILLDEFGTGAMCVQRSAAFLGIELPTK